MPSPPPTSTLFPYTTLFRSQRDDALALAIDLRTVLPERRSLLCNEPPVNKIGGGGGPFVDAAVVEAEASKVRRLKPGHRQISYAVFCLKKKIVGGATHFLIV